MGKIYFLIVFISQIFILIFFITLPVFLPSCFCFISMWLYVLDKEKCCCTLKGNSKFCSNFDHLFFLDSCFEEFIYLRCNDICLQDIMGLSVKFNYWLH